MMALAARTMSPKAAKKIVRKKQKKKNQSAYVKLSVRFTLYSIKEAKATAKAHRIPFTQVIRNVVDKHFRESKNQSAERRYATEPENMFT